MYPQLLNGDDGCDFISIPKVLEPSEERSLAVQKIPTVVLFGEGYTHSIPPSGLARLDPNWLYFCDWLRLVKSM